MGIERIKRPLSRPWADEAPITTSTAASTALLPRGTIALETTSTGSPVVYTLADAPRPGRRVAITVKSLASSSDAPFHINAGAGRTFDGTNDMLALSTAGAGVSLVGLTTAQWGLTGSAGATLSTST